MKHFITLVSHQGNGSLKAITYIPIDNSSLAYDYACSFPIIPVIVTKVSDGDSIALTVIKAQGNSPEKNAQLQSNFQTLLNDIEAIKANLGIQFSCTINIIETPYDATLPSLEALTSQTVASVTKQDQVFACMTFGEKPDAIALQQALMEINTDASETGGVELCVYGEYSYGEDSSNLKDITNFVFRTPEFNRSLLAESSATDSIFTKKYLTVISLFPQIQPLVYFDEGGRTEIYKPVCFPITAVIANTLEEGDNIRIGSIVFTNTDRTSIDEAMRRNTAVLEEEVAQAITDSGVSATYEIVAIPTPYHATNTSLNELCDSIAASINLGDKVYADVTFGQKSNTIAIQQALSEAAYLGQGITDISCYYGYYSRAEGAVNKLKELTPFVLRGAVEHELRERGLANTEELRSAVIEGCGADDESDHEKEGGAGEEDDRCKESASKEG